MSEQNGNGGPPEEKRVVKYHRYALKYYNDWDKARGLKFTDDAKAIFLWFYSKSGRRKDAAKAAGISVTTVKAHLKSDPVFKEAFEEAQMEVRDLLVKHAFKVAVKGVNEPLIGGQYKDEIIAYKKVYDTRILAMLLKQADPSFREHASVDHNVKGGVLLIPATESMEEWMKKNNAGPEELPPPEDAEVVE